MSVMYSHNGLTKRYDGCSLVKMARKLRGSFPKNVVEQGKGLEMRLHSPRIKTESNYFHVTSLLLHYSYFSYCFALFIKNSILPQFPFNLPPFTLSQRYSTLMMSSFFHLDSPLSLKMFVLQLAHIFTSSNAPRARYGIASFLSLANPLLRFFDSISKKLDLRALGSFHSPHQTDPK